MAQLPPEYPPDGISSWKSKETCFVRWGKGFPAGNNVQIANLCSIASSLYSGTTVFVMLSVQDQTDKEKYIKTILPYSRIHEIIST